MLLRKTKIQWTERLDRMQGVRFIHPALSGYVKKNRVQLYDGETRRRQRRQRHQRRQRREQQQEAPDECRERREQQH